jgi:replication-associated recombination protein RarA
VSAAPFIEKLEEFECPDPAVNQAERPLSERMCPQTVDDLTLPRPTADRLGKMIETRSPMNMAFYGKVGTGKTTAAQLFKGCGEINMFGQRSFMMLQPSFLSAEFVRNRISAPHELCVCIIDDADLVPKAVQRLLPSLIDEWRKCRFIFTAISLSELVPELRSRLLPNQPDWWAISNIARAGVWWI